MNVFAQKWAADQKFVTVNYVNNPEEDVEKEFDTKIELIVDEVAVRNHIFLIPLFM